MTISRTPSVSVPPASALLARSPDDARQQHPTLAECAAHSADGPVPGTYDTPKPANQPKVTRLKMTLHHTATVSGDPTQPLTRCTFGAVYSPDEATEDSVFGKATPFASLTYNVRSEIAEHLVVGEAYYVDIHPVTRCRAKFDPNTPAFSGPGVKEWEQHLIDSAVRSI